MDLFDNKALNCFFLFCLFLHISIFQTQQNGEGEPLFETELHYRDKFDRGKCLFLFYFYFIFFLPNTEEIYSRVKKDEQRGLQRIK